MSNDADYYNQLVKEICKFLPGKTPEWFIKNIEKSTKTKEQAMDLIKIIYEFFVALAISNRTIVLFNKSHAAKMQINTASSTTLLAMMRYPNVIKEFTQRMLSQEKLVGSKYSRLKRLQIQKTLSSLLHRKPGIYFIGDMSALKILKENKKLLKALKEESLQGKTCDFKGYGGIIINTKVPTEEVIEILPRALYLLRNEICNTKDALIIKTI